MMEMIWANWPLFVIALLIGIAAAWLAFRGGRRTRVEIDRRDALDEGAAPAARNQALIDAAPTVGGAPQPVPPIAPPGLAGAGTAVAAAVEEQTIEARKAAVADAAAESDDLTRIKGLGPRLAETLHRLGVTRFKQIAAWSDEDIDRIDGQLGRFSGRVRRDGWVEQAGYLARGDIDGFKARFGAV